MHRRHAILPLTVLLQLAVTLLAACGGSSTASTHPTMPADGSQVAAERQDAAQLYGTACASCHGPAGEGGLAGVPLGEKAAAGRQKIIDAIRYGVGGMPASSGGMSDEQINALADYVAGLR